MSVSFETQIMRRLDLEGQPYMLYVRVDGGRVGPRDVYARIDVVDDRLDLGQLASAITGVLTAYNRQFVGRYRRTVRNWLYRQNLPLWLYRLIERITG